MASSPSRSSRRHAAQGFNGSSRNHLPIELLSFTGGMHQFPLPAFSRLTIQPGDLLPAGMEITSYNHHANAPSSPGALVLKPRLPGRSSLRSYPINPSRFSKGGIPHTIVAPKSPPLPDTPQTPSA